MDSHHGEESGEMYSPNEQGEYTPEDGAQALTVQGLADTLSGLESEDTVVEPPKEELILQLEVTMADRLGRPCPPAFSWNAGMVMHVLKNDPALRDLEYVQVDNPGTAYLFFLDKQCRHGLPAEAAETLGAYLPGAFSEWISHSAHFAAVAIPLAEGRRLASVAAKRCHQRLRTDPQGPTLGAPFSSKSDVGPVLVGSTPPTPVRGERGAEGEKVPAVPASRARGRPPKKARPVKEVLANSPPSPNRGGADLDVASMVSEMSYHSRQPRRHRREKHLAPAKLDLPIFKSMDPSSDVTYTIWRFDVQSWLEQYTEESMKPHIYASLRGYPGCWVCSLEGGEHLNLTELLQCMDRAFREVSEVDTMIRSMYKICQVEKETVEEYMLHIHEALVVIRRAYPERLTNQDKNFLCDHFYNGLLPSLREALGFVVADLPEREQTRTTFDTLITLARKMEAHQSNRSSRGASSDGYRDRYRQYPNPANRVATVGEGGDFLPPNPEEQEPEPPGDDPLDGLSTQMTQAMNHFQWEERRCFIRGQNGHFVKECPHKDAYRAWQKQLNFQGAGQHQGGPTPKNPSPHPTKRNPSQ